VKEGTRTAEMVAEGKEKKKPLIQLQVECRNGKRGKSMDRKRSWPRKGGEARRRLLRKGEKKREKKEGEGSGGEVED